MLDLPSVVGLTDCLPSVLCLRNVERLQKFLNRLGSRDCVTVVEDVEGDASYAEPVGLLLARAHPGYARFAREVARTSPASSPISAASDASSSWLLRSMPRAK